MTAATLYYNQNPVRGGNQKHLYFSIQSVCVLGHKMEEGFLLEKEFSVYAGAASNLVQDQ